MTEILLAGDTHGNTNHVRYLIDTARRHGIDRIFQVGDWGAWEHVPDGRSADTTGTLWFPEEELTDAELAAALADPTPVDVMLTHDKPRASDPRWNRKDQPECWPNQDRIQQAVTALCPRLLIHGHLHYPYKDQIRSGGDSWTTVIGLDADPSAAEHPGYAKADSWMILDLAEVAQGAAAAKGGGES